MALEIKVEVINQKSAIIVSEVTGDYNAITNPTGWFPNITKTIASYNSETDTFTLTDHGFFNGQKVKFDLVNGQSPSSNLVDNQEVYIVRVDANSFKLSSTSSGTSIIDLNLKKFLLSLNNTTDVITIPNHGFVNGQKLKYFAKDGRDITASLTQDTDVYVAAITTNTFQIANSVGTVYDLLNPQQTIVVGGGGSNGTCTTTTITKTDHGYRNGAKLSITNTNGPIMFYPGFILNSNNIVYVINRTPNTFQISLTQGGGAITPLVNSDNFGESEVITISPFEIQEYEFEVTGTYGISPIEQNRNEITEIRLSILSPTNIAYSDLAYPNSIFATTFATSSDRAYDIVSDISSIFPTIKLEDGVWKYTFTYTISGVTYVVIKWALRLNDLNYRMAQLVFGDLDGNTYEEVKLQYDRIIQAFECGEYVLANELYVDIDQYFTTCYPTIKGCNC